jgi:hypothetical protein
LRIYGNYEIAFAAAPPAASDKLQLFKPYQQPLERLGETQKTQAKWKYHFQLYLGQPLSCVVIEIRLLSD